VAYDELEPFGEWREDYRIGQLCSLLFNVALSFGGKKGSQRFSKPTDFMLWSQMNAEEEPAKAQTIEEMKKIFGRIVQHQKKARPIKPMKQMKRGK